MSSFTFYADFAVKDKIKLWDFEVEKTGAGGKRIGLRVSENF